MVEGRNLATTMVKERENEEKRSVDPRVLLKRDEARYLEGVQGRVKREETENAERELSFRVFEWN